MREIKFRLWDAEPKEMVYPKQGRCADYDLRTAEPYDIVILGNIWESPEIGERLKGYVDEQ